MPTQPTPSWDLVEVRMRYIGTDGSYPSGRVQFTPKASRLVDQTALTTLIGRTASATLENGMATIFLPASDDPDIAGSGFTYTVKEDFVGGATPYEIAVPLSAAEAGIDLALVAPIFPNSGTGLSPVSRLEYESFKSTFDPELLDQAIAAAQEARDEAIAAQDAAEAVGATNDAIIAGRINTSGSATRTALTSTFAPLWKTGTAYTAGQVVQAPDGGIVKVATAHTATGSYDPSKFVVADGPATAIGTAVAPVGLLARRAPTFAPLGDSITRGDANPDAHWYQNAWPVSACAVSIGQLKRVGYSAVAGENTAQIFARVAAALAGSPGFVSVLAGVNDVQEYVTGAKSAQSDANCLAQVFSSTTGIPAIVAGLLAGGAMPVLCTIPPRSNPDSVLTTPQITKWRRLVTKINLKLRAYAEANHLPVVDFYSLLVDPTTGGYKAAFAHPNGTDGVHPGPVGHAAMGALFWQVVAPMVAPYRPPFPSDVVVDATDPVTLLPNPLFALAPWDAAPYGQVPNGWPIVNGGGTGMTLTVADDAGGFGKRFRITRSSNTAELNGVKKTGLSFVAGHRYRFVGKFASSGGVAFQAACYAASTANWPRLDLAAGTAVTEGAWDIEWTQTVTGSGDCSLLSYDGNGWVEFWRVALIDLTALGI